MAGELVGGAFLSATLQVLIDQMASPPVLDFFKGQKLDDKLLKKLTIKMITVDNVLVDAEDKQHTNPKVEQWVNELKDVVYEAEDLLDEIASEVQRSKIEAESQTTLEKLQDFASSHNPFKTGKNEKLEEILGALEYLVDQKGALGLIDGTGAKLSYQRTPTTSIPDESVIYGRDADKEAIMNWVLSDDPNSSKPDVLAIVGIGGIGKTTLSQHVYSDSRVHDCFDKKAWVCVSEEFNVSQVTKDILEEFTSKTSDTNKLNQLQNQLMNSLTGKKFLLVLDDIWSKDYLKWENLLKPLRFGKEASKILVTSRNLDVADCIKTSPTHQLQKLSDDDCWSLFEKHAFMGNNMSHALPDFERIGRQIVEKCDGLPLAAKLLGGALRSERNPEKWIKILESDLLDVHKDSILPILKLSYGFLPSHLKRCFAYCAIFPKDYEFEKEKLIRLWMAEGLLIQPEVKVDIEHVGEDCFDDLVSRSFFQQSTISEHFLMHDLINDLAKSISGEFCFRYGVDRSCEMSERIRHLWLGHRWVHKVNKRIFTIQHLRSILLRGLYERKEVKNLLPTFTRLRVLSLFWYELPDSIGNLMHLRYLDLSGSSIERLPHSVVSFYNLETLILFWRESLVELPATIFKLINLSHLDIRGTQLRKMPPHMGKLKKLGVLTYYIVGKESDCSIKELGPLKHLRGHLRIEKLRNVLQVQETVEANLKCKEKLKGLELIWNDEGNEDSSHERKVLEQLQPHTNIERLSISGYAGARFPDWVGDSSFSNMVELNLVRCRYCSSLPTLWQLGSLKRLSIIEFDEITVVGTEFYGNSNKPPFGCLERLKFEGMRQWQEWVPYSNKDEGDGAAAAFPLLRVLEIVNCPNLIKTLPVDLPCLTELQISGCGQLASFPRAPSLQKLVIVDDSRDMEWCKLHYWADNEKKILRVYKGQCPDSPLEIMNFVTSLRDIKIRDCDSLTSFPLGMFPLLETLEISSCPKLESLLGAAAEATLRNLKTLIIKDCPNLKEIQPTHLSSLTTLEIRGCDQLVSLPRAPSLQKLMIKDHSRAMQSGKSHYSGSRTLEVRRWNSSDLPLEMVEQLMAPNSIKLELEKLVVGGWDSVTGFPLDIFPMLLSLEICNCPKLEFLSAASQAQPLQLCKSLKLWGCPNLKSLPERMASLFPSLMRLCIEDIPESIVIELLRTFPNLSHLYLYSWCEEVESLLPKNMLLPPTLSSLQISHFPNLKSFDTKALQSLTCLKELMIQNCPKLQSLPGVWLPSTLTSVQISEFENLESLDHWGLHHLTSLTELFIYDCPKLQSIPKEALPSSLERVRILGCPLLQVGQDWPFDPPRAW